MSTGRDNVGAIAVAIAKGWKPNYYLTNMSMAYFEQAGMYVAPSIFPVLPVDTRACLKNKSCTKHIFPRPFS